MKTSDFDYYLPEDLIAQERVHPYDHSKLLVLDKQTGKIEDTHFYDIPTFLSSNDVLVFNNTKVFKARIEGKKENGKPIEVLLLEPIQEGVYRYRTIMKGGPKQGAQISFMQDCYATIVEVLENGERIIEFNEDPKLKEHIDTIAQLPLPHYIHSHSQDYQTVYADVHEEKSIAAPTAGFHFTPELLEKLQQQGITTEYVSLNVGIGTFRPVKTDIIEEHDMHFEEYAITQQTLKRLNTYKKEGRRIIAVGTTSVRTLEDSADDEGILLKQSNNTNIFIYPPYKFKFVDAMITNFHLPKSTLIMLVSAFAGKDTIMKAYSHAVKQEYRFFSFGDAMFIK